MLVEGAALDAGPELVGERLLDVLREPFEIEGYHDPPLAVTASIGIAVGDRNSAGELLRDADIALYRAKASGKNRFVVFASEMRDAVDRPHEARHGPPRCIGARRVLPRIPTDLRTERRPESPAPRRCSDGAIPLAASCNPRSFVPLLEESGRIVQVGRWVLTEACRQAARWRARGHEIDVAVNVSVRQLEDRGLRRATSALRSRRAASTPRSLIIEITETAIMRDAEATAERLRAVKQLGVRIAIDDFGTGYSSLAYLRQFPVDSLKIDRSFIAAIGRFAEERRARPACSSQLGKALGLETLAEGIEDQAQYTQLQDDALRQRPGLPDGEAA